MVVGAMSEVQGPGPLVELVGGPFGGAHQEDRPWANSQPGTMVLAFTDDAGQIARDALLVIYRRRRGRYWFCGYGQSEFRGFVGSMMAWRHVLPSPRKVNR